MSTAKGFRALLVGSAVSLTAMGAAAVPTVFSFTNEFSGSGFDCNGSCATLSVEQVGTGVNFVFSATLTGFEKITELTGNRAPYVNSVESNVSTTGLLLANADMSSSQDSFKADGDGFFDWEWKLGQGGDTFNNSDVLSWTFANTNVADIINAKSVNGPVGKNGFTFAIHSQGLGQTGNDSGWMYATYESGPPITDIPEPATALLAGLALLGLAASRKRRQA